MKRLIFIIAILFFSNAFAQNSKKVNSLLLEEVTIISPEKNDGYIGYILINDNRIKKVSKKKPRIKEGTKIINLKGRYIIPGLIDNHVHLSGMNGLTDDDIKDNPEIVKAFKEQLPKSYLYFGYTTLIDLATPNIKELEDFKKASIRPDLYHVGSGAVIGKGYGITNWSDTKPNFIYVDDNNQEIPNKYNPEDHSVKAVVSRIKESGAIGVKTYYEPGFDPNVARMPVPTTEIMIELYKESQSRDLVLMVHANSIESHGFLAKHKIDVISHGLWRWGNIVLEQGNEVPKEITNILDLEIKNKIAYTPTLQVINGLKAMAQANYLENPELKKVLPSTVLDWYKINKDKMYKEIFGDAPKDIILNSFDRINSQGKASLKYISRNGGVIVFGTDTPSSLTYGNPPGYNGYLEMKTMYKAGISLKEILKSATINNARTFKLDSDYGTIENGKIANLVVLKQNPLKSIKAYNNIEYVIVRGKVVKREILSSKL
ncbi:amidohydrolase family protein [Maribacter litoralis]|uniref:amidohydrolase family protein n=1 Tax=Maribacter litoralis TaxID=2059726 RepID=UPI000E32149B|nr:amidohydrolase family protein [Maribacter litoralis]